MLTGQRVIVAVREPTLGSDVIPYARFVVGLLCATEVHVVHVHDQDEPAAAGYSSDLTQRIAQLARDNFGKSSRIVSRVLEGDRLDCLLRYAVESRADIALLGHRRASVERRSLARRLAMKAPCSVWMAPEGSSPAIQRVIVGVDFSESSLLALQLASRIGVQAGARECLVFHVTPDSSLPLARLSRYAAPAAHSRLAMQFTLDAGPTVSDAYRRLALPDGGDLFVVGARGQNPSSTIMLGSEAEQLLRDSGTPVLVATPVQARAAIVEALLGKHKTSGVF